MQIDQKRTLKKCKKNKIQTNININWKGARQITWNDSNLEFDL
jgi:hypothetical protein